MGDLEELTAQVEATPEDHELRWGLAKKLYKSGDYRGALKHLQTLRGQWTPKINVARYLAATYYRLGRYDQSIAELEDAVNEWPEEIALHEQLARVFEVAGRKERALRTWKEIAKKKPGHSVAIKAVSRLETSAPPPVPQYVPGLDDHDFGLDSGTGLLCPSCGTMNTGEFKRCWKCNTPIWGPGVSRSSISDARPTDLPSVWHIFAGTASIVLVLIGAWLTFRQFLINGTIYQTLEPLTTVQDMLDERMLYSRLILAGALLLGWPLALWVGVTLAKAQHVELLTIAATGVFFSACLYVILWLPPYYAVLALPAFAVLAALPILIFFRAGFGQRAVIYVVQAILVTSLSFVILVLREGPDAVTSIPTLVSYSSSHDRVPEPGDYVFPPLTMPVRSRLQWDSSGSAWLDKAANRMIFTVSSNMTGSEITLEIKDGEKTEYYNKVNRFPFKFLFEAEAKKQYELLVDGPQGGSFEITMNGILVPRHENK